MRILVIGASGTIGSAVARALAADHDVIEASRSGPLRVDITEPDSIRAMYREVGTVGGVVCCAGGGVMKPLTELVPDDWTATFRDKVMGQVNLVTLGVDHVADGGVFVLTAGVWSQKPMPGVPAIALANGAVESFARAAALDLPREIRLNAVSPPLIQETARQMGMDGGLPADDNARAYADLVNGERNGAVIFP